MWSRSSASRLRYAVRRAITSSWWLTQWRMNASRLSVRGTPSTSASMFAPNVCCSCECLYRLFSTTFGTASRFSTSTRRWPVRPDVSSRMSAMPWILPSRTASRIETTRRSGFTWYGSSVTTRHMRPLISSVLTTARIVMRPRPVRYACSMPLWPRIVAPVGKSGPLMRSISASSSSSRVASGWSSAQCTPSATSRMLCGGMFVAMPTAMPDDPLTSRFGKRAGSTVGSCVLPS